MKQFFLSNIITVCFLTIVVSVTAQYKHSTSEFSIQFPGKPAANSQVLPTKAGELTLVMNTYTASDESKTGNLVFMTNETVFPIGLVHSDSTNKLDVFFKGSIDGAAKKVNGTVKNVNVITKNGYPGREVDIEMTAQKALIKMVYVIRKNNLIIAQVISESKKASNQEKTDFFNSFVVEQ
jgi:hypothetical protein